jgi:hypothetical protein
VGCFSVVSDVNEMGRMKVRGQDESKTAPDERRFGRGPMNLGLQFIPPFTLTSRRLVGLDHSALRLLSLHRIEQQEAGSTER